MSGSGIPDWFAIAAAVSVGAALLCAVVVAVDEWAGRRHHMAVMDLVWPITMLWSGPLGLWAYWSFGRAGTPSTGPGTFPTIAKATTHCGSGCAVGDVIAETMVAVIPLPLALFGQRMFGTWVLDFVLALLFGAVFQYFTIKPMRDLSPGQAIRQALKADVLSLSAWQIGMYGGMAALRFGFFHHDLPKGSPPFWLAMQLAMLLGFLTAYPVNAWLLARGIKESM